MTVGRSRPWPRLTRDCPARTVLLAAAVVLVTALLAARDRLLPGEVAVVELVNGNVLLAAPVVETVLLAAMGLGTLLGVAAVAVGVALLVKPWQPAVAVLVAGAAAWLASDPVKALVGRGRPVEFLDAGSLDILADYGQITGAGYPSGHTTVAFALATVVAPWVPRRFRWVPWTLAASVGVARLYVAAHFPLDLLGGAALGILIGSVVNLVAPSPEDLRQRTTT